MKNKNYEKGVALTRFSRAARKNFKKEHAAIE